MSSSGASADDLRAGRRGRRDRGPAAVAGLDSSTGFLRTAVAGNPGVAFAAADARSLPVADCRVRCLPSPASSSTSCRTRSRAVRRDAAGVGARRRCRWLRTSGTTPRACRCCGTSGTRRLPTMWPWPYATRARRFPTCNPIVAVGGCSFGGGPHRRLRARAIDVPTVFHELRRLRNAVPRRPGPGAQPTACLWARTAAPRCATACARRCSIGRSDGTIALDGRARGPSVVSGRHRVAVRRPAADRLPELALVLRRVPGVAQQRAPPAGAQCQRQPGPVVRRPRRLPATPATRAW